LFIPLVVFGLWHRHRMFEKRYLRGEDD
jgi:hypothetical protein